MKFKLLTFFMFATINTCPLVTTVSCHAASSSNLTIPCAPQLQNSLKAIKSLKEGDALISKVLKDGLIRFSVARTDPSQKFGACWDPSTRTIFVDLGSHSSQGALIGSLVFELYNALKDSELTYLAELAMYRKISKENYVKAVEYIEYQNSIEAAALTRKGIEKKIFSESAELYVYDSFDEHYHYQKLSGHSAIIGHNYDSMASMR